MQLPDDIRAFIEHRFPQDQHEAALAVLAHARIEDGSKPSARLLRCAAVASRGDLQKLQHFTKLLALDWRDVIMAGEYERRGGQAVQVRDLNQPLADVVPRESDIRDS